MAKDLKGIYQYTELDDEATFSELLNLGQQSISDAMSYFAGPSVQRIALDPAPPGAMWQDTDNGEKLWSTGPDGAWRLHSGELTTVAAAWATTTGGIYYRPFTATIPTVIGPHERIEVAMSESTGVNMLELGNQITRNATNTIVQLRFMQFYDAATRGCKFTWKIAKVGS